MQQRIHSTTSLVFALPDPDHIIGALESLAASHHAHANLYPFGSQQWAEHRRLEISYVNCLHSLSTDIRQGRIACPSQLN